MQEQPRRGRLIVLGTLLAFASAAFTGCAPVTPPDETTVLMQNIAFTPSTLRIKVGDTVTWTNTEVLSIDHTVTSGDPDGEDAGALFDSGLMGRGDSFTHTFDQTGTFVYFCEIHPVQMRDASIIVEE